LARLFGTDGVRGIANVDLKADFAFKLGQAGARVLGKHKGGVFLIGKDTRTSGDMFEAALTAGICSVGGNVLELGVVPTPVVAYLTKACNAQGGIVISASHNPAEYNGIKFFGPDGFKLSDEKEDEIEAELTAKIELSTAGNIGTVANNTKAVDYYIEHALNSISTDLDGFSVAIDCGHGAAYKLSPQIFRTLGAKVMAVNTKPNGTNINLGCGSTHIEYIQEIVTTHDVSVGFAHDGDADRVIAIDENGDVIDGDFIMAICAAHLKKKGQLPENAIVSTVMANLGFDHAMSSQGIEVLKTKVGDRYVLEEMLRNNISIGGEQSGHIIFLKHATTGDGIITAVQLASVIMETGQKLSELKNIMTKLPQVLINVKVSKMSGWEEVPAIKSAIKKAEADLGDGGRILVRASGTEPLVRVMVESGTADSAKSIAIGVADVVRNEVG
jgi:phosphoglucosamine mutase